MAGSLPSYVIYDRPNRVSGSFRNAAFGRRRRSPAIPLRSPPGCSRRRGIGGNEQLLCMNSIKIESLNKRENEFSKRASPSRQQDRSESGRGTSFGVDRIRVEIGEVSPFPYRNGQNGPAPVSILSKLSGIPCLGSAGARQYGPRSPSPPREGLCFHAAHCADRRRRARRQ